MRISKPRKFIKHGALIPSVVILALISTYSAFCQGNNASTVDTTDSIRKTYRATHLPWAATDAPEMVQQLIKDGQDVNSIDQDGRTALHMAVFYNNYGTAKLLVDNGASVNVVEHSMEGGFNGWGWYPLHLALRNENMDIVKLLIDHGADVNAKRTDGWTPILTAAYHGRPEQIALLISKGADINYWNSEALRLTIRENKLEAAQLFLDKGVNINGYDDAGRTAMHNAARRCNAEAVKLLIRNKAKVDMPDKEGQTPLYVAASSGFPAVARMLILKGANVNARDNNEVSVMQAIKLGKKAYMEATAKEYPEVKRDWYEVMKMLLRNGAK